MDQSLVEFEKAFANQIRDERLAATLVHSKVAHRARQRDIVAQNRRGTLRFAGLALTLVATATVVTVVMFRVLYLVLGS